MISDYDASTKRVCKACDEDKNYVSKRLGLAYSLENPFDVSEINIEKNNNYIFQEVNFQQYNGSAIEDKPIAKIDRQPSSKSKSMQKRERN